MRLLRVSAPFLHCIWHGIGPHLTSPWPHPVGQAARAPARLDGSLCGTKFVAAESALCFPAARGCADTRQETGQVPAAAGTQAPHRGTAGWLVVGE